MKRIEFSDNAYEIMEKTGVGEDVVEQIIMHQERDIGENQDSDPAEEGIKVVEESRGGFRVRWSTARSLKSSAPDTAMLWCSPPMSCQDRVPRPAMVAWPQPNRSVAQVRYFDRKANANGLLRTLSSDLCSSTQNPAVSELFR